MALISAVVCPHPPGLVPAVAGDAAGDWDRVRRACMDAVRGLDIPVWGPETHREGREKFFEERVKAATTPEVVVIVGGAEVTCSYDSSGAYASLRAAGIDWEYGWEGSGPPEPMPPSVSIGYWLMRTAKPAGIIVAKVVLQSVAFDASPQECADLGRELAGQADRVAMLVLGEGSAVRGVTTRPHPESRAGYHDREVARALSEANTEWLAGLRPGASRPVNATGRAAWQVLAGAAGGQRFRSEMLHRPGSGEVGTSW